MPETRFSIPLYNQDTEVIGCPALGDVNKQRTALTQLLQQKGWPVPEREGTGRPRMGDRFCSLTHGGGWALATRSDHPIGIDVEAANARLERTRRRFVGPMDQPVVDWFGDNLDALCRLWTAKEAAYKTFGSGVDFLTGLQWVDVHEHGAQLLALKQNTALTLHWRTLDPAKNNFVVAPHPLQNAPRIWAAICGAIPKASEN